jgi:hypothetical protein
MALADVPGSMAKSSAFRPVSIGWVTHQKAVPPISKAASNRLVSNFIKPLSTAMSLFEC